MAIKKYEENGKEFWKVYVHIRSKTDRKRRIQRYSYRHKSEAEALKEEKRLIREVSFEIQKIDSLGLNWDDVVHLWWEEVKAGYLGDITWRSAEGYLSIVRKWTKAWNKKPAAELTRADARELMHRLDRAKLSKAYQKKVKNIVNKVFEWGMEFRHIKNCDVSPFKGISVGKVEARPPEILTLEEIKKLLSMAKALEHRWYPIWAFAILTGMRSGELHALTWEQIDLEKKVILVDRSYDSNTKSVGPTKARYWRTIPVNRSLENLILDLKRDISLNNSGHVLPRIKDWDNGDQAVPLKNFLKSINLKPVKFHALRACFATQMLAGGVPAPVVMKIGGWKKSSTMDIYLRLAGVDTKGATDCLQFVPEDISFGDNVVWLHGAKNEVFES